MRVKLWGTRGSLARSGPETVRYGGDTAAVQVVASDGTEIILDAGSGILRLGEHLSDPPGRIDILLTHLHMDHIQGLGFFLPLFSADVEVHIWGPTSTTLDLRARLTRYLSPPLFPVRIRDLVALEIHDLYECTFEIGPVSITAAAITHPGHTFGYRLEENGGILTYMSDHEPALGVRNFPPHRDWTSGAALAADADVLIHDAQYTDEEYAHRVGWGHSTFNHAIAFAEMTGAKTLVTFHHDPSHSDDFLDHVTAALESPTVDIVRGMIGREFAVGDKPAAHSNAKR